MSRPRSGWVLPVSVLVALLLGLLPLPGGCSRCARTGWRWWWRTG